MTDQKQKTNNQILKIKEVFSIFDKPGTNKVNISDLGKLV